MATIVWAILCFTHVIVHSSSSEAEPPTDYKLHNMCGRTVDVVNASHTSGVFKLYYERPSSSFRVGFGCFITLKAPPRRRVLLKFTDGDIEDQSWRIMPCEDFLFIYKDKYVHKEDKDKKEPIAKLILCGENPPDENFMSIGNEMTIYFHTNVFASDAGYKMYFNAFHDLGPCGPGEFQCDNGHCIDSRLKCNGYDNCGDRSDICPNILAIVLGTVGAVLFVVLVVGCCCYCKRKGRKKTQNKYKATTTETVPMNPPRAAAAQPNVYVPKPTYPQSARSSAQTSHPAMPQPQYYDQLREDPPLPPPGRSPYPQSGQGAYHPPPPMGGGAYSQSGQDAYYPPPPLGEGAYPQSGQDAYQPPRYAPPAHRYPGQQPMFPPAELTNPDEYTPPSYPPSTKGYTGHSAYDRKG